MYETLQKDTKLSNELLERRIEEQQHIYNELLVDILNPHHPPPLFFFLFSYCHCYLNRKTIKR